MMNNFLPVQYIKITPSELKQSDAKFVYIKIRNNYFMAVHDKGMIKLNEQSDFISAESIVASGYELYILKQEVSR